MQGQLEHERKEDFSQGLCTQVNTAPQWHSILDRVPKQVPVASPHSSTFFSHTEGHQEHMWA